MLHLDSLAREWPGNEARGAERGRAQCNNAVRRGVTLGQREKVGTMSAETDAIDAADTELTHAMGRLLRAMDAAGDDGEAARYISERMPEPLEELARRINAAQGLGS
jgi:hypothetical protein